MRTTVKNRKTRAARIGRVIDKVTSDAQAKKMLAEVLKENAKALKTLAKL
ncbi:hypothetical protein Mlute_00317 [Meiothermus luteus]|jgi:hypothetical protein|uniref:Uncharacterized protein n=1 Tax=Meiothermus luteus TaxID=2026184 RepID=A0A399F4I0_9DEIN|nr:hypothetical protein [Meiothermus luteus]RIH89521.1 hypothetical protein Mlute_00317 [Meiothermus luteus]